MGRTWAIQTGGTRKGASHTQESSTARRPPCCDLDSEVSTGLSGATTGQASPAARRTVGVGLGRTPQGPPYRDVMWGRATERRGATQGPRSADSAARSRAHGRRGRDEGPRLGTTHRRAQGRAALQRFRRSTGQGRA
jgi:hypothetical protein